MAQQLQQEQKKQCLTAMVPSDTIAIPSCGSDINNPTEILELNGSQKKNSKVLLLATITSIVVLTAHRKICQRRFSSIIERRSACKYILMQTCIITPAT
jgi:hypothetical protein